MYSETVPPVLIAVLILGIHSILQPYKSWRHNVIDTLIFLNITIINCSTIMIKFSLITESTENVLKLELIQLAFVHLPFLSLLLILMMKFGKKVYLKHNKSQEETYQHSNITETAPKVDITHSSVELNEPLLLDSELSSYF